MIRSTKTLAFLSFFLISISSLAYEIDSTEDSSIDFLSMEATLSSRIVHFKWQVSAEVQGDYFIIEKSLDQKKWVEVKRVKSIKNHDEQHTYEISEINFAEGVQEYFRILRVDSYGVISELDRVDINQPVLSNMLMIPEARKIEKQLNVSYDSMIASDCLLRVQGEDGEIVLQRAYKQIAGYNRSTVQIKGLAAGRYLVIIEDEFGNKISKSLLIHSKFGKRKF